MEVEVHDIGRSKAKLIVIDDFLRSPQDAVNAAAGLPPFPAEDKTAYPGRRHQIGPGDKASACVMEILRGAGPVIERHYDVDNFRVLEASFSLATVPPAQMSPRQRVPHYDSTDPNYMALLLHLHSVPETGTAFYRHVATGLERVSDETAATLRECVSAELSEDAPAPVDLGGRSTARYENIFRVEGRFNRLVIYQGSLLHSGYFSPDFDYSSDPRTGRLTANVFIQTGKGTG